MHGDAAIVNALAEAKEKHFICDPLSRIDVCITCIDFHGSYEI